MLSNELSVQLRTKVEDLVQKIGNDSEVINVHALFTSPSQPNFNVSISKDIKEIIIRQEFLKNYTDKIIMKCQVPKNTYIVLYNSRKDLQCLLEFSKFDPMAQTAEPEKPYLSKKYRAVLLTNTDIFKQVPAKKMEPNEEDRVETDHDRSYFNVEIELITETVFLMRKKRLNFVATTATMKDILHYTANAFGITKAVIVPPDNETVYTNFFVPPTMNIAEIMHYYQKAPAYGVYNNGFCYYVTDDTLFVYPRFGTPLPLNNINIYSIGEMNYEGMSKYSLNEATSLEILCNTIVNERNWSDIGSENNPTAYNTLVNETLIDGMKRNMKDEVYTVIPNVANHIVPPSDPASVDSVNIHFKQTRGNTFSLKSDLFRYQGTSLGFEWKNAHPFSFLPGTNVHFHYDDKFGYACLNCTCEMVIYTITQIQSPLFPTFAVNAQVVLNHMNQLSN